MTYMPVGTGDVPALLSTNGTVTPPDENGFVTLTVATFLFMLDGSDPDLVSVQILTDATIVFVSTVETCNFPKHKGGQGSGAIDVSDFDVTGSLWTQENPSTAYIGTTGTGWTPASLTLTKAAGVGSAMIHLGNDGARRTRLKLVVSTGGKVRVNRFGKKG
jgi:hypothetical protein